MLFFYSFCNWFSCLKCTHMECETTPECQHFYQLHCTRPAFWISLVKSEMSISRISMSRVVCLRYVCVFVWVCVEGGGGRNYLSCPMLKKIPRWHFFEGGAEKAMHHPLVCVKGGEYLSSEGLHGKSRLDDFIFCSPLHLRPIKWQDWQIRHPFSALLLTYSFLCPPFLYSSLVFLLYFLNNTLLELTGFLKLTFQ